jgi:taurine dioxygenase
MAQQGIHAEKLTPHAGAIVHDVDLSKLLDDETFKAIHDALIENCVIFFRDQHLTPDQQKDFGRRFGELHVHPAAPGLVEGHPEILVIRADETSKHVAGEN